MSTTETLNETTSLQALIKTYTQRTAGSKQYADAHRAHLVDKISIAAGATVQTQAMSYPIVIERAEGARLWDIDGNEYLDILQGLGTHLFGHNPEFIRDALDVQLQAGFPIGTQSSLVGPVAELLVELTGLPRICFSNTGTEAIMTAIRVARTKTDRSKVVLFTNSYHGHADTVLMRAPITEYARKKAMRGLAGKRWLSPLATLLRYGLSKQAVAAALGIPASIARDVLVLEYDNPRSLEIIKANRKQLAAVLVEPVQSRHPEFQPREFLHELRDVTRECDIALIFDEMVTGFRIRSGGAQAYFGIEADLATYSKIVGGGLPLSIIAGRHEYMDCLQPNGNGKTTFFAGTFCKHPLALAASLAVLTKIKSEGPAMYEQLNAKTANLVERLNTFTNQNQIPVHFTCFGSFFSIAMSQSNISPETLHLLSYYLLNAGIHLRAGDRGGFLSTAHTDADIDTIVSAFSRGLLQVTQSTTS